ncbi:unnamed protein product [Pylaiella littoralis]
MVPLHEGNISGPTPAPEASFFTPIVDDIVGASGNGTTANSEISSQGFSEFLTTLVLSLVLGLGMLLLFEIKRNKSSVYAPRLSKLPHRAAPELSYGPLRWVWKVATLSGPETLRLAGMDAYCLLRFNYLCLRICFFASFWGMLVLTPVYALSGTEEEGSIYYLTLANVDSDSNTLWVTVVFAYLFTWHALYVLRGEHQAFAEMREEFLTHGDPDFAAQTRYTTKVENVPAELRSAVALEAYFDDLFPGQVHSAVMCLNMPNLEVKVENREIVADKLEKTRSQELLTGKEIQHRNRRFMCDCCAPASGMSEAEVLSEELAQLNKEIGAEQKAFLQAAQRLNSMDDRLMQASMFMQTGAAGENQQQEEGGADVPSLQSGNRMGSLEKIDFFLKSKSEMQSQWAMQEVEDVADESLAASSRRSGAAPASASEAVARDEERGKGEDSGGGAGIDTSGIEEELAARAKRVSRTSSRSSASGGKGSGSGNESVSQDASPKPGLMEAAPDMAKEALSSLAFVGHTAFHTTRRVARGVLYLTLGQKMSTTGFVTFRQMSACAASRQVLLAPRPDWCDAEPAPDPRDVVWKNIAVPQHQNQLRHVVAGFLVALGAIFWSIPVVLIQFWASYSQLETLFPVLADVDEDSFLYYVIAGYLPVVLLLLLMMVLPFLFQQALAYRYERRKSHSEVQRSILTRYFTYQVANIYVTVASGSIISALQEIIDNPASVLSILGDTFPAVAVYFLDVIVVKIFVGLAFELVRGWPLIRVMWSQRCTNRAYATEREVRTGPFGPAELLYGWVYPTLLLVLVVCFVYAVISPFIMPAGAIFFATSYLVYKYQVLYVYVPKYESGGVFWFSVYPRVLTGLALAQLTLAGYVYVRAGYYEASFILALPVLIFWYGHRSYHRYVGPAKGISMETAARTDRRGAAAMAAAVKAAAEGRRGKHWEGSGSLGRGGRGAGGDGEEEKGVNPDDFEPLLYAQLALTSPAVEPNDCSPRESAVEASRLRLKRDGAAPDSRSSRSRSSSTAPKGEVLVRKGGKTRVTPFAALRGKPSGAAFSDVGSVEDGCFEPLSASSVAAATAATAAAADEPARRSSREAVVGAAGENDESQLLPSEFLSGGRARTTADEESAEGREGALGTEEKKNETVNRNGTGTESEAEADADAVVMVPATVAAVAATVAAGDREANHRFGADGGPLDPAEGLRALTRREQEGLRRRALAEDSLVSSKSSTRRPGNQTSASGL